MSVNYSQDQRLKEGMHGRVFRLGSHPDLCETRKVLGTWPHSPQCDRGLPVAASPLREPHGCGEEGVTRGGTAGRRPGSQGGAESAVPVCFG